MHKQYSSSMIKLCSIIVGVISSGNAYGILRSSSEPYDVFFPTMMYGVINGIVLYHCLKVSLLETPITTMGPAGKCNIDLSKIPIWARRLVTSIGMMVLWQAISFVARFTFNIETAGSTMTNLVLLAIYASVGVIFGIVLFLLYYAVYAIKLLLRKSST